MHEIKINIIAIGFRSNPLDFDICLTICFYVHEFEINMFKPSAQILLILIFVLPYVSIFMNLK